MALPLGQGLPGLTGSQALGGVPLGTTVKATSSTPYFATFPAGYTGTWVCPRAGRYVITMFGAGASGSNGIAGSESGCASQSTRNLKAGDSISITIPNDVGPTNSTGTNFTLTLPDGTVMTCAGSHGFSGFVSACVASGGDTNVNGQPPSGATGGNAPTIGNYIGGKSNGGAGGGGGQSSGGGTGAEGGKAMLYIASA